MSNEIVKAEVINALQRAAEIGVTSNMLTGFQKAFTLAGAVTDLQQHLTPAIMRPVKSLMGLAIGFKSDKTDYSDDIIKNCLIEAVLYGVQPVGNQFNIIAGRAYITKEGFRYLLKQIPGLKYTEKRAGLPVWESEKVTVNMSLEWEFNGEKYSVELPYAFKIEKSKSGYIVTTDDNITGKATRKTLKWLYEKVSGIEMPDGDADSSAADRAGLDPKNEIKNPLQAEPVTEPQTAEDILTAAGLTLEDVGKYCLAENQKVPIIMERIEKNPGGAIAKIKTFKEQVLNQGA